MADTAPEVVTRYFAAADARDFGALADCFTADGRALDEGKTHTGRDEIIAWREAIASAFTPSA
jgi:ketosteroid isomerase-like protein